MRTIRTPHTRDRFCASLENTGNVTETCRVLDLSRTALYDWREEDPEFADAWEAALDRGIDALEDEAKKRAMTSSDYLMAVMLKAHRPDKYRERSSVEFSGTMAHISLRKASIDDMKAELAQLLQKASQPALPSPEGQAEIEGAVVVDFPTKPPA